MRNLNVLGHLSNAVKKVGETVSGISVKNMARGLGLLALGAIGCGDSGTNRGSYKPPVVDAGGGGVNDPLCAKAPVRGNGDQLGDTFVRVGRNSYTRPFPGKTAEFVASVSGDAQEFGVQSNGGLNGHIASAKQAQDFSGPSFGVRFEAADKGAIVATQARDSFTGNVRGGSADFFQVHLDDAARLGNYTQGALAKWFDECFAKRGLTSSASEAFEPSTEALSQPARDFEQITDTDHKVFQPNPQGNLPTQPSIKNNASFQE